MKTNFNMRYVLLVTFVAALGGVLFGYDTAVISGTTGAIKSFFVDPLIENPSDAVNVMKEYNAIIVVCFMGVLSLLSYFLFKLYTIKRALLISVLLLITGGMIYFHFLRQEGELTVDMANSIRGFTISSALIGCIIGGALGGVVSSVLGRKKGLLFAAVLFAISALGSAYPDYMNVFRVEIISSLILYRIIGGVGVGLASILTPMYIAEIAPAEYRGRLVSVNQFAVITGMILVYFVNYHIAGLGDITWLDTIGWRYMFLSELIPAALFFVMLFWVPESPRFLVMKGDEKQAGVVLKKLMGTMSVAKEILLIKQSLNEKHTHWLSYGSFIIVVGIFISFFQQAVGINVVLYYAPEIFRSIGASVNASLLQTIIVGIINMIFTCVAIFTVDKFGRKPLLMIGALGMGVCMLSLGFIFYFNVLNLMTLIVMLFYMAFFAMSWGPVAWVFLSEMYPNSVRSLMAIAVTFQWIFNFIVSWTFPVMNDNIALTYYFNHGFSYWIYGLMGLLAAVFVWLYLPETKGKSLEDIENLWRRVTKKNK